MAELMLDNSPELEALLQEVKEQFPNLTPEQALPLLIHAGLNADNPRQPLLEQIVALLEQANIKQLRIIYQLVRGVVED